MTKDLPSKDDFFVSPHVFLAPVAETSQLVVSCAAGDYSASRIAHAVEDCDAPLLNLNVAAGDAAGVSSRVTVSLRIGHRDPERVARSLERYGYEVVSASGSDTSDDRLRRNYDELMHLLHL